MRRSKGPSGSNKSQDASTIRGWFRRCESARASKRCISGEYVCVKGSKGETKSWKQGGRNEGGGGREGGREGGGGRGEARSTSWGDQRQFFLAPALQLLPDGARLPTFVFAARTSHILVSRGIVTVPTTPAAHVKCKHQRKQKDRPKKQVHGVERQVSGTGRREGRHTRNVSENFEISELETSIGSRQLEHGPALIRVVVGIIKINFCALCVRVRLVALDSCPPDAAPCATSIRHGGLERVVAYFPQPFAFVLQCLNERLCTHTTTHTNDYTTAHTLS